MAKQTEKQPEAKKKNGITNGRIFVIRQALMEILSPANEEKVRAFSAYKMIDALEEINKRAEIIRKVIPGFIEYEKESNSPEVLSLDMFAREAKLKELKKKYADDIKRAEEFLKDDYDGDLPKIKMSELKTDRGNTVSLTYQQAAAIRPILDEDK